MPTLHSHTHCQAPQASSNSKACQRVCLFQRTDKQNGIKHETLTRNIRKPGDVGNLNCCTFNQNCNGLISWSFEIPASAYCHRYGQLKEMTA